MTRLTLEYHLRTIRDGTTDNAHSTGMGKYHPDNGDCCVALEESMAAQALQTDDPVAFLDAVAHDPVQPMQWRFDAQELLETHIMERRCIPDIEDRSIFTDDDDSHEVRNEFIDARRDGELPKKSMQSDHWWPAECPNCGEGEVLYDPDARKPQCHCGTPIPQPTYPDDAPV